MACMTHAHNVLSLDWLLLVANLACLLQKQGASVTSHCKVCGAGQNDARCANEIAALEMPLEASSWTCMRNNVANESLISVEAAGAVQLQMAKEGVPWQHGPLTMPSAVKNGCRRRAGILSTSRLPKEKSHTPCYCVYQIFNTRMHPKHPFQAVALQEAPKTS